MVTGYTLLKTERWARKVAVFVDWDSARPTTNINGTDTLGNDHVATFDLRKLPFTPLETLHRIFGGRSSLYVRNFNLPDDHPVGEREAISARG